jgi:hypothetical protein
MYGVLKHIVNKVGVWFDKIIENLQDFEILLLSFVESAESHIISVKLLS